jgi:hypothetical protein
MGASAFCPFFFYNIRLVRYFFKRKKRKRKGGEGYVGVKEPDLWNERRNEEHLIIYLLKQTNSSDTCVPGCIMQPRTRCCRFMTVLFPGCQWQVGTRDGDVTLIVPTSFGGQNSLSFFWILFYF